MFRSIYIQENFLREVYYIGGALAKMDMATFQDDLDSIKEYFGDEEEVAKLCVSFFYFYCIY